MIGCLALLLILCINIPPQERFRTEISVCDLEIQNSIKQANASFSVSYSFQLDKEGRPVKVSKIQDRYVRKGAVEACLSGWRFQGLPSGTQLVASFRWQHGKGWVEIAVVGKNFSQVVRLPEGLGY
ncbi:MAG: hypothetical protein ACRD9S_25290 [Pyrinomonadaceae bacterium]